MKLAEKIQKLLDSRNLSLRDAAPLLGPSYGTLSRWVNGKVVPRLDEAVRIAEHFGVPLSYLADDSQDEPPVVTPQRRQIEKWIARFGEDWALDRLAMVPDEAGPAPARRPAGDRQPLNFPPSSATYGPDGKPTTTQSPPGSGGKRRSRS